MNLIVCLINRNPSQVGGETVMSVVDPDLAFLIKSRKPETLQYYDVMDINRMYDCAGDIL